MHTGCQFTVLLAALSWACEKPTPPAKAPASTNAAKPTSAAKPTKAAEPTKESQCKEVEEAMLAAGREVRESFKRGFCLDFMTSIEISCVLEAATDATLLACFAQDHRSGMVVICSAPDKVVLSGAAAENAFNVSNYIATHLRNPELIKFYSAYGGQAPAFLSAELAEMAKTANLPSCALAQYYKDMIDPQHP